MKHVIQIDTPHGRTDALYYDRLLTTREHRRVVRYLADKHGIKLPGFREWVRRTWKKLTA